jgi:hypothetical protein
MALMLLPTWGEADKVRRMCLNEYCGDLSSFLRQDEIALLYIREGKGDENKVHSVSRQYKTIS